MSEVKRVLEDPPINHCDSGEQRERDLPEVTEPVRGRDRIRTWAFKYKSIAFPVTHAPTAVVSVMGSKASLAAPTSEAKIRTLSCSIKD